MKLLLFIILAYLTYRLIQNALYPRQADNARFRVIFPERGSSPKEKDISDRAKVVGKGEEPN
ncbi:hypothetical protein EHQ53_00480 [Leptospira langatensis]|uniref:Uncharacterized protein n=1 Tax=Leptospira langatensis TaxID=2484983 RepID=A0A5F1ZYU4_9LEPT|nr:hypothetical protein [Leptospira langatensis]TGJ98245.1 hypothetical protein EHO57_16625 [Leptospira langatensis]TGL43159.1 hypothetical protein EHQ53_00480 [Leptospira langatensis]